MVSLIYDGSWAGLLTCIFEVYRLKLKDVSLVSTEAEQPGMFNERLPIGTDEIKAGRVFKGLQQRLPAAHLREFYACYLSELPQVGTVLLEYARLIFACQGAEQAYGNDAVLKVSQTAKMVAREAHRMKGFIRFALTKDDIYYAGIEPDFNVVPLISGHFRQRYADQQWLIYDIKRKYGIFYDLNTVSEVVLQLHSDPDHQHIFSDCETHYQTLWKEYYVSTGIASRKNTRLHLRHVPRRYWKHLTEKIISC